MIKHSKIYRGKVVHERIGPVHHAFSYPMTFFGLDLSELKTISQAATLFGYNESRPLRLNDCDFLRGRHQAISEQLDEFLPLETQGQRTLLISSPRYFGYAFNPVNFYLRMEGEKLLCAVAEVNNTFGDRHIYPLKEVRAEGRSKWSACCPKDFHVSPFNDMSGEYRFSFHIDEDAIFLGVDLWKEGACTMKTWIQGEGIPLNNKEITRYAFLHPLDTAINSMPRILWQAAVLYYRKKMRVYQRPRPESANTVIDRDQPEAQRDTV